MDRVFSRGGLSADMGPTIRELRRKKGLKQHQLAEACGISASYVGHIETGRRGIEPSLLERICSALELAPSEVDTLLRQGEHDASTEKPDARIRRILEEACSKFHASSCTFYVRDPFWPGELRLIAMPGVRIQEPMYGFVSPEGTRRVLQVGDCEFCSDTLGTTDRRDTLIKLPNTIPSSHRVLFSDFVEREGVRASARLLIKPHDAVEAVLFVNFPQPTEFTSRLRQELIALRDVLQGEISAITRMLRIEDSPMLQQAINLVRPMQDWVARIGRQQQTLEQYLESVLDDVMAAVGMDIRKGFGTIHLYRPESENQDLILAAHRGTIKQDFVKVQSVVRGEGIISWVALRQRALVIANLESSQFRLIHLSARDGIASALAVPMIAGNVLIGVLNLESELPEQFESQHVRALWYAAGCAGVAARLYRQAATTAKLADMSTELLRWFCLAVATKEGQDKALAALARTACASLGAQQCDMWSFDPTQPQMFRPLGASYPLLEGSPRDKGWSEYVCRTQCEVWISNIRTTDSRDVSFWNSQLRTWERTPPRTGSPESANPQVLKLEFVSELGIQIVYEQECVGVAWLKFNNLDRSRPSHEEMLLAERFAESVGRVLKSLPPQQHEDGSPSNREGSAVAFS